MGWNAQDFKFNKVWAGMGVGLFKNKHSASGSGINEKNHNITELPVEAGFMVKKYTFLSEIEAGLMQEIISKCMLY